MALTERHRTSQLVKIRDGGIISPILIFILHPSSKTHDHCMKGGWNVVIRKGGR